MKSILVTGGAGFIGCNFVRFILGNDSETRVTVYDKLTYAGRLENLADVETRFGPRYAFVQGDICDAAKVEETVTRNDIDTIVNFAAETHVDRSILDPDAFVQTDVYGTYVILEAARRCGNLRFHQISTDEVYGHIDGTHRSTESDSLAPRSPYSASKASADLFVNAYHITYGLPVTVSRGANNIGPYQYPEKVVPLFITNALSFAAPARIRRWPADAGLPIRYRPLRRDSPDPAKGPDRRGLQHRHRLRDDQPGNGGDPAGRA